MKKQLLTLLLLVCSLGMDAGNTLIPDMKFRRLDTRDGLSNSQINYIFQDSKGFVWIATSYGLNRQLCGLHLGGYGRPAVAATGYELLRV